MLAVEKPLVTKATVKNIYAEVACTVQRVMKMRTHNDWSMTLMKKEQN
jgi:hypothetical protein